MHKIVWVRLYDWCIVASFAVFFGPVICRSQVVPLQLSQYDHMAWTSRDGAPLIITHIQENKDGTLWLVAGQDLYSFNGTTFTPFEPKEKNLQIAGKPISTIHEGKDGTLWVGFMIKGIAEIQGHRVVKVFDDKSGLPEGSVDQILEAPDGTMIAVARSHLMQLKGDRWLDLVSPSALNGEEVIRCFFEKSGALGIATNVSVWELAADRKQLRRTAESGGRIAVISTSPDENVWIGTGNPGPSTPTDIHHLFSGEQAGSPSGVFRKWAGVPLNGAMMVDTDGALWAGSWRKGVVRTPVSPAYDARPNWLKLEQAAKPDLYTHEDGLTSDLPLVFFQDHLGSVWVGTSAGLDRFRKPTVMRFPDKRAIEGNAITACPNGEVSVAMYSQPLFTLQDGRFVAHGTKIQPQDLHCDAAGVVWVSDLQGLFGVADGQTKHIANPPGVAPINIRQVVGNGDRLYVSYTRNGLWKYESGTWSRVVVPGFPGATPYALYTDSHNRLWTGYVDSRIAVLDNKVGRTFLADNDSPLGIIEAFLESPVGMFVGASNGLAVFRNDHLQRLVTRDQAAIRGISGILQAKNGDLWLNGAHGIVRIRASEIDEAQRSSNYQMRSDTFAEAGIVGPAPSSFWLPSAVKDSKGVMWFSTSNVLVSVDPESLRETANKPILTDLSMTIDGRSLPSPAQVDPGYHTFRIGYLGAYLAAPEKVRYRYRLEGVHQTWQDVGTRTEAVYTGLKPGTYRFSVIASNDDVHWSQPDSSLQFTVLPSFYQKPIFVLLCVLVGSGLLWLAYRLKIRAVATAIRMREVVRADERIRIARDLHDTLLQGVQGLALRFGAATKQLPSGSRVRESLETALVSADRLIEEARNRVSSLRAQVLTEQELIEGLRLVADEHNEQNQTRFRIDVERPVAQVSPSVWEELFYIGREAITNAFRHSKASEISVSLRCISRAVVFIVSDDGAGFDIAAYRGAPTNGHWGLHGMEERAEAMGATFKCVSKRNVGTEVTIVVPMRRNHLKGAFSAGTYLVEK